MMASVVRRATLVDLFREISSIDEEFLVYEDAYRRWSHTYKEVSAAARGFAQRLLEHGLRKDDTVIVWSENRPEWIAAFWGAVISGIVVVPIDYRASPSFVDRVRRIVRARIVLAGDEVIPGTPADTRPGPEAAGGAEPVAWWRLADLDWRADAPVPAVELQPDSVVEIVFTSGATADPKGVVITHRNLLANLEPIESEILKYRRYGRIFFPLRFLNLLPLSHMFGQAAATLIPPLLPGTTVFLRSHAPADIVRVIRDRRVSVLVVVPKILEMMRDHVARVEPVSLAELPAPMHVARRWWRYRAVHRLFGPKFWCVVVGAAPLGDSLERFWSRLGFLVIQGYGLTETAPIVTLNHPFAARAGSVGKPISGVEVRLAPDGEILVRGDNVTRGYFDRPAETATAFQDGWLRTGDIGEIDTNGHLFIRGRKKEVIVTAAGLNVFPEDVEKVLLGVTGVREAAVVGLAESGAEYVHAVVALEPDSDVTDVVRRANVGLADHQRIRGATVWPGPRLPRTEGTEKLKRAAIRRWVEQGARPLTNGPAGVDFVSSTVARLVRGARVGDTATLEELGLGSLERVELLAELETRLGISLDERALAGAHTVGELRAAVERSRDRPMESAAPLPSWPWSPLACVLREVFQAALILPLTRAIAWTTVSGQEHLHGLVGPVIFVANHQSHLDTPVILSILPRRLRRRTAIAMAKEWFSDYFHPQDGRRGRRWALGLVYQAALASFAAFPLPQRETGARDTFRHVGSLASAGWSILIFPEGRRTDAGEINRFLPGAAMLASRLRMPVVPIRVDGVHRVLHRGWRMVRPGRVRVAIGPALPPGDGSYAQAAIAIERAVRGL